MSDNESIKDVRCPSCRKTTLFVANGGLITCSAMDCKNPSFDKALDQMIENRIEEGQKAITLEWYRKLIKEIPFPRYISQALREMEAKIGRGEEVNETRKKADMKAIEESETMQQAFGAIGSLMNFVRANEMDVEYEVDGVRFRLSVNVVEEDGDD